MDEEKTTSSKKSASKPSLLTTGTLLAGIAIALVVGIGGFIGGMQFQKGKAAPSVAAGTSDFSRSGFAGGRNGQAMNGSFGAVTAVSATSISVQDRRSSTAKTYNIISTTTITSSGAAATTSDIAVGDNVIVRTASASSTDATSIAVNPTMGGPSNTESAPTTVQ
jgi:hypothetical protein